MISAEPMEQFPSQNQPRLYTIVGEDASTLHILSDISYLQYIPSDHNFSHHIYCQSLFSIEEHIARVLELYEN